VAEIRRGPKNRMHLADAESEFKRGFWVVGGPYLTEQPVEGRVPSILGSTLIAVADTKQEVLDRIRLDVYTKEGVWDLEKVQIWQFRSTMRIGM
jgi:uncharacterized protein